MSHVFHRGALGAAAFYVCAGYAWAQTDDGASSSLHEITVNADAGGSSTPASALGGDALLLRSQGSLGQTLDGLPGVSSSYFGPTASRPVIRGLDGDRIRIMSNGGASPDASALSYDHAVPTDPLTAERIEVLRGPAALQYGGSAVGGLVNVIDSRIPREPINGFGGRADLSYATGNREGAGGVLLEGGDDRYALHVDGFRRVGEDVAVPIELPCEKPGSPALQQRMCNSASRSDGGAVGGTLFFDHGWIGASASTYRNDYGSVAEDDVRIDMRSNRYSLEGEWRLPGDSVFTTLHAKFNHTDYQHTEFEGPLPGTLFTNNGNDARVEARHGPVAALGGLNGVIGYQGEFTHFNADGEEAFAPRSSTRSNALFVTEELPTAWGQFNFGARTERVRVQSFGSSNPEVTRFAVGEHAFDPFSAAVGAVYNLTPQWRLNANLAYTERAPKDYELFANGPHIATGAWEMGDATLGLEKSVGLDLGAQWQSGPHSARVDVYANKFRNYIAQMATGRARDEEGEPVDPSVADALPEYHYRGVHARFTGLEASGTVRLVGEGGLAQWQDASTLELEWRGDLVRATDTDTDEPLPRIAPARVGATLAWVRGAWTARFGFDAFAAQDRVPAGERETGGYTLWNASLNYRMKAGRSNLDWYARLDNIGDRLAYSATSILTTTAYPKVPLPGRSLRVGLRVTF